MEQLNFVYVLFISVQACLATSEEGSGVCSTWGCLSQLMEKQIKMQIMLEAIERKLEDKTGATSSKAEVGSTYIRWGRTVCSGKSELVYTGFAAGNKWNARESGSNQLCLPADPTWLNFTEGDNFPRGHIFGAEFDVHDTSNVFSKSVLNQDIPCSLCKVDGATTVMIPGRNNCYRGWRMEYNGYIMAAYYDYQASNEYICVDADPDFFFRGAESSDQNNLCLVEAKCGSLPCPPYVQGRELACVVCSK